MKGVMKSRVPSALDESSMTEIEYVKQRTQELYDFLPLTTLEERMEFTDVRDEIIALNYSFFGYVASSTYVCNSYSSYEDKLQSALANFLDMWAKYKFVPKYRADLSFAVFFKLRLGECVQRELNEVKYSTYRTLAMKAADVLGIHWTKLTYDDLNKVTGVPVEDIDALKRMMGAQYPADYDQQEIFNGVESTYYKESAVFSKGLKYNTIPEMLCNEMIVRQRKLTDKDLLELSMMLDLDFKQLKDMRPQAEATLYQKLKDAIEEQYD